MMIQLSDLQMRFTSFKQFEPNQNGRYLSGYATRDKRLHGKTVVMNNTTKKAKKRSMFHLSSSPAFAFVFVLLLFIFRL